MPTYRVRIGAKGRAVIPAPLRAELELADGDELLARVEGDRLVLETRDAIKRRLRVQARATGAGAVVEDLLAERREQAQLEEGRAGDRSYDVGRPYAG